MDSYGTVGHFDDAAGDRKVEGADHKAAGRKRHRPSTELYVLPSLHDQAYHGNEELVLYVAGRIDTYQRDVRKRTLGHAARGVPLDQLVHLSEQMPVPQTFRRH